MLEEAYALRVNHVEKRRKELGLTSNDERFGIPETLPELKALLFVIDYGGSAWEADKRGLQKEILKGRNPHDLCQKFVLCGIFFPK